MNVHPRRSRAAPSARGKIKQAVVYDPSRNDIFTATRGRSADMNDRRLRLSRRIRLQEGLVSTGFPFRPGDNFKSCLAMMNDLMLRTGGLQPWDVAAGSLLVSEAGGLVGNFTGEADFLEQRECMAASPRIYGQLVQLLGKYSKFAGAGEKASVRQAADAATAGALLVPGTAAPAGAGSGAAPVADRAAAATPDASAKAQGQSGVAPDSKAVASDGTDEAALHTLPPAVPNMAPAPAPAVREQGNDAIF